MNTAGKRKRRVRQARRARGERGCGYGVENRGRSLPGPWTELRGESGASMSWRTGLRGSVRELAASRAGRDGLFVLFLLGLLGGSAWFTVRLLSGLDSVEVQHLFPDDAYYYFQIARNLAAGQFSTFDGGITVTNGYHPVWLFLITPLYWVFESDEALEAVKALEIGLLAGGVALVAVAARLARLPWILLAFVPLALSQHGGLVAGMEASARLFSYGLLFAFLGGYARNPERWKWPLAGVAFVLPWVRLEDLAVAMAVTATLLLLEVRSLRGGRAASAALPGPVDSWTSLPALRPFLAAAASLPVYCAYQILIFGGPVPVSGAVKRAYSQVMWARDGGYDFMRSFRETVAFEAFDSEALAAVEICAYLLILLWIGRSRDDWLATVFLLGAFGLAVGHLATFWHFVLNLHFAELVSHWYYTSARLMMAILIPVRCYVGICLIRKFVVPKLPRMAEASVLGVVMLGLAMQVLADSPRVVKRTAHKNPLQVAETIGKRNHGHLNYFDVQIMNRLLPSGSVVGVWNAGEIGYYSRFPVVNLDGLVNSYDFLNDLKSIHFGFKHRWDQFSPAYYSKIFSKYGITHFADLILPLDLEERVRQHATLLFEGQMYGDFSFKIFSTDPNLTLGRLFEKSDYFFERMKPHWTYQSDGISAFTMERVVRVFAKDCEPKNLENDRIEIWWREENSELNSVYWEPWKAAKVNSLGFCESTYILPKNAVELMRMQAVREDAAALLDLPAD